MMPKLILYCSSEGCGKVLFLVVSVILSNEGSPSQDASHCIMEYDPRVPITRKDIAPINGLFRLHRNWTGRAAGNWISTIGNKGF